MISILIAGGKAFDILFITKRREGDENVGCRYFIIVL